MENIDSGLLKLLPGQFCPIVECRVSSILEMSHSRLHGVYRGLTARPFVGHPKIKALCVPDLESVERQLGLEAVERFGLLRSLQTVVRLLFLSPLFSTRPLATP